MQKVLGFGVVGLAAIAAMAACGPDPGGAGGNTGAGGSGGKDPAQLDAPASGQGFQFATQEFEVAQGDEVQDCYFFKISELAKAGGLDPTKPVNLHRVQIAQRTGSHHMNVFRVRTVVNLGPDGGAVQHGLNGQGECFKSANWADWPLVTNSQEAGNDDWTYPDGVANVFQPDEWIMLQTHFVNATTQKTPAKGMVRVNFGTIPATEVKHELGTIFATKQSIRICESNPSPSFAGTCQINSPNPVHVIGANGHFHSRGTVFDMFAWDGTSTTQPPDSAHFYQSKRWDEPPMMHSPDLDVTVPAKGGIWYTCAYEWQMPDPSIGCKGLDDWDQQKYGTQPDKCDCCYTFGPIVEKNEHCNAFVYYYPKQDDVNCF
jgi:hypothetical protein